MDRYFADTYDSEVALVTQIENLKAEGYVEADMFILAKKDQDLNFVRRNTDVEDYTAENDWRDRFSSIFSGNEDVRETMRKMDISDAEADRIYKKVEQGQFFLYANRNYAERLGQDSFKLGEKEKTELQNEQLETEDVGIPDNPEQAVTLDERHYEDPELRRDKRRADPISKPDEKNFI